MRRRISFTASGPVRGQGRPRAYVRPSGHAGLYQTDADMSYREMLRILALEAMREAGYMSAATGSISGFRVYMRVWKKIPSSWPKKRQAEAAEGRIPLASKPDIDNVVKMVLDAMNGIVYPDDRLVVSVMACKGWSLDDALDVTVIWDDGKEDGDAV